LDSIYGYAHRTTLVTDNLITYRLTDTFRKLVSQFRLWEIVWSNPRFKNFSLLYNPNKMVPFCISDSFTTVTPSRYLFTMPHCWFVMMKGIEIMISSMDTANW